MFNQDAEKEYRRLSQFVTTLNHPIDLTESEYKKYRNLDEVGKAAFLKEIDKKHGAVQLSQDDKKTLQAHEESRNIMGNHPMNMKKDREARVWECLQKKKNGSMHHN